MATRGKRNDVRQSAGLSDDVPRGAVSVRLDLVVALLHSQELRGHPVHPCISLEIRRLLLGAFQLDEASIDAFASV